MTPPFSTAMNGSMMPGYPMQHNHSIPQNHFFPGGVQMMHPYSFPGYYQYGFPPMGYPAAPMMGFPPSYPFMPQNIHGNQICQPNKDNVKNAANQSISNEQSYSSKSNCQNPTDKR
jgi:hypothetical protein